MRAIRACGSSNGSSAARSSSATSRARACRPIFWNCLQRHPRSAARPRRSEAGRGVATVLRCGGEGAKHGVGDAARRGRGRTRETAAEWQGPATPDCEQTRVEHPHPVAQARRRGHDLRGRRRRIATKPGAPVRQGPGHIAVANRLASGLRRLRLLQSRLPALDRAVAVRDEEPAAAGAGAGVRARGQTGPGFSRKRARNQRIQSPSAISRAFPGEGPRLGQTRIALIMLNPGERDESRSNRIGMRMGIKAQKSSGLAPASKCLGSNHLFSCSRRIANNPRVPRRRQEQR